MNLINIPEWWAKSKIRTKSRKQKLKAIHDTLSSNELKHEAFRQLERLCGESDRLFEELVRKEQRHNQVVFDAHEEKQTARETIETLEDQVPVVKLEERLKQEVSQNKHLEDEVNQLQTRGGLESSGAGGGGGGGGNDSHLQLETKTTSDPSPRLSEVENNWESSENNSENIGDSFNEQQLRNELESLRASSVEQKKNALLAAESLRVSNEEDKKTALLDAQLQREELESLLVSKDEEKKKAVSDALAAARQDEENGEDSSGSGSGSDRDSDTGSGAGANDAADAPDIPPPTSPAAPPAPPVRPSAATRNLAAGTSIVRDAIQNGIDGGDKSLNQLEISLGAESKLNILPVANTTEELQESINSAKLSFDLRNAGGLTARFKIGQKLQSCWNKWKEEKPNMNQANLRRKIASMGFIISKTKMSSLLAFATVIKKYKAYRFLYTCTVSWSKVLICMGHDGLEKALENSLRDAPVAFKYLQWDLELE